MSRRRGGRLRKGVRPQLDRAKRIVSTMTARGAQASTTVHNAIRRAGISTRTYRTARKALGTVAVRASKRYGRRGRGRWYAKKR